MRGIVIAGGLGTRLRPLTLTRPKPLMPLVGAPLLEYQISYLRGAGITDICFATNYMSEAVEGAFGSGSTLGVSLSYAVEREPLDTAGAIRNAYDAGKADDCVVFNGDVIHGFDIADILRNHEQRGADVSLTLFSVQRPHAYGRVAVSADGRVEGFFEPTDEQKRAVSGEGGGETDSINAGLYVMSAKALETIPQRRCNIEREVFPKLIADGWKVYGDIRSDYWIDIGRPSQYLDAVAAIVDGKVGSPRPFLRRGDAAVDPTADVHDEVKLCCSSSVGANAVIEQGAEVCASAILEGARIGAGAKVIHSVVGEGAVIGENARVVETALAPGSVVGGFSALGQLP